MAILIRKNGNMVLKINYKFDFLIPFTIFTYTFVSVYPLPFNKLVVLISKRSALVPVSFVNFYFLEHGA